jgi:hypothetical protein
MYFRWNLLKAATGANRVARRVSPPGSHTTVHAGPRTAVPDSPCG